MQPAGGILYVRCACCSGGKLLAAGVKCMLLPVHSDERVPHNSAELVIAIRNETFQLIGEFTGRGPAQPWEGPSTARSSRIDPCRLSSGDTEIRLRLAARCRGLRAGHAVRLFAVDGFQSATAVVTSGGVNPRSPPVIFNTTALGQARLVYKPLRPIGRNVRSPVAVLGPCGLRDQPRMVFDNLIGLARVPKSASGV